MENDIELLHSRANNPPKVSNVGSLTTPKAESSAKFKHEESVSVVEQEPPIRKLPKIQEPAAGSLMGDFSAIYIKPVSANIKDGVKCTYVRSFCSTTAVIQCTSGFVYLTDVILFGISRTMKTGFYTSLVVDLVFHDE
ncbi:hypothetical protein OUZ56_020056 [Daphnia magna]|uniref:Uncharacterized protein n=1 Tax=Daphnia magna TaxID=35525 RepID=A0ABQ9ZDF1_9CRUS|nr:hypothetical protein OUZ56_020056 [Daphnia magna]